MAKTRKQLRRQRKTRRVHKGGEYSNKSQNIAMPPGWIAQINNNSGETYYEHKASGVTTWNKPTQLKNGWEALVNNNSGNIYYRGKQTGTTQWEWPEYPNIQYENENENNTLGKTIDQTKKDKEPEQTPSLPMVKNNTKKNKNVKAGKFVTAHILYDLIQLLDDAMEDNSSTGTVVVRFPVKNNEQGKIQKELQDLADYYSKQNSSLTSKLSLTSYQESKQKTIEFLNTLRKKLSNREYSIVLSEDQAHKLHTRFSETRKKLHPVSFSSERERQARWFGPRKSN